MKVYIGNDKQDMAAHAAKMAGDKVREAIRLRGEARIIVATGASQFEFLEAFVKEPDIDWTNTSASRPPTRRLSAATCASVSSPRLPGP